MNALRQRWPPSWPRPRDIITLFRRWPPQGPMPQQPARRMTREEAVRCFSIWNARSIGREADQGSLEPGRCADGIALFDDVFTCAEEKIAGIAPTLTMVDGAVVAGAPAAG